MSNFHSENIASILNKFNSNMDQGLSADTLQRARAQYGKNELEPAEQAFSFKSFLERLLTWRILVLALSTLILIISFANGASGINLYTIGLVGVVLIMHIGWVYLTDYRSRIRDNSISQLMIHNIKVIRQGKIDKCVPQDLVPGDLLSFSPGDYVPADARIIESEGLMIDESVLLVPRNQSRKQAWTFQSLTSLHKDRKTWHLLEHTSQQDTGLRLLCRQGEI